VSKKSRMISASGSGFRFGRPNGFPETPRFQRVLTGGFL
jgi:hypothetical protein